MYGTDIFRRVILVLAEQKPEINSLGTIRNQLKKGISQIAILKVWQKYVGIPKTLISGVCSATIVRQN